jgi:hypothetical protein
MFQKLRVKRGTGWNTIYADYQCFIKLYETLLNCCKSGRKTFWSIILLFRLVLLKQVEFWVIF